MTPSFFISARVLATLTAVTSFDLQLMHQSAV